MRPIEIRVDRHVEVAAVSGRQVSQDHHGDLVQTVGRRRRQVGWDRLEGGWQLGSLDGEVQSTLHAPEHGGDGCRARCHGRNEPGGINGRHRGVGRGPGRDRSRVFLGPRIGHGDELRGLAPGLERLRRNRLQRESEYRGTGRIALGDLSVGSRDVTDAELIDDGIRLQRSVLAPNRQGGRNR